MSLICHLKTCLLLGGLRGVQATGLLGKPGKGAVGPRRRVLSEPPAFRPPLGPPSYSTRWPSFYESKRKNELLSLIGAVQVASPGGLPLERISKLPPNSLPYFRHLNQGHSSFGESAVLITQRWMVRTHLALPPSILGSLGNSLSWR